MRGRLSVVVGGQFGSEGKGAIAGYLTRPEEFGPGVAVRVAGPNAGHTVIGEDGRRWPLRQIPVAAVTNPSAKLAIAAGSEIDPEVLLAEAANLEAAGYKVWDRLHIDPQATIITEHHRAEEAQPHLGGANLTARLGSTGKGIGAARADRAWRRADIAGNYPSMWPLADVSELIAEQMASHGANVLIEGTQGYGLGLHAGWYPFCTSSDCRAIDFLAMAGVNPWAMHVDNLQVWCVFRPYPIRVAGNSGPLLNESTWEMLGLPVERTTVTQKVRRVGLWDPSLARDAVAANGGPAVRIAFTMADQVDGTLADTTDQDLARTNGVLRSWIGRIEGHTGAKVYLVGTSPATVIDLRGGVRW